MATSGTTAIHCPSCGRRLTEAEEIRGQRLRCKSCSARLIIDLTESRLVVEVMLL